MANLSCNKCSVEFPTRKATEEHYSSRWHQFNLTRHLKNLPMLTEAQHNEQMDKSTYLKQLNSKAIILTCKSCKKNFATQGSYDTHVKSRKHKDNLARMTTVKRRRLAIQLEKQGNLEELATLKDASSLGKTQQYCMACKASFESAKAYTNHINTFKHVKSVKLLQLATERKNELNEQDKQNNKEEIAEEEGDSDEWEDEEEGEEQMEEEDDNKPLPLSVCLFCGKKSINLQANLGHMQRTHSFIIPHQQAGDLEQLHNYLGEKIGVGHQCLECSKSFRTLAACRKHMLDKPHLAIRFEGEYDQFFEISKIMAQVQLPPKPAEGDMFCFPLPDGTMLTHRDLRRYFKQRLSLHPTSMGLKRLTGAGPKAITHLGKTVAAGSSALAIRKEQKKIARAVNTQQTKQKRKRLDIGIKANKLQPHFRLQVQNAG